MTAPTLSAFPRPVEDLIPAARDLADRLGELPSRNRIKKELRVGGPKADAILAALTRTDTPSATEPTPDSAVTTPDPIADPAPVADLPPVADDMPPVVSEQAAPVVDLGTNITTEAVPADSVDSRRAVVWPVVLLALPAFVAIWSGWVGLGGLTGFGVVHPLPGIWDSFSINSAITLRSGWRRTARMPSTCGCPVECRSGRAGSRSGRPSRRCWSARPGRSPTTCWKRPG